MSVSETPLGVQIVVIDHGNIVTYSKLWFSLDRYVLVLLVYSLRC